MGDEDPCRGAGDGSLEVLGEPAAPTEPGEGALDDPASGKDDEAARVVCALDHLDGPRPVLAQGVLQLRAAVSAVGKHVPQPGIALTDGFQHLDRAVPVLDVGTVNDQADHQPERVGDDVALAAFDLLAGVVSANSAALHGLDALAVDHARRRARFAALQFAGSHNQMLVDAA